MQWLNLRKVLNCFRDTGGFSVAALAGMRAAEQAGGQGGGAVTSIDLPAALERRA